MLGIAALLSQTFVLLVHRPLSAAPMDLEMGADCSMMAGAGATTPAPDDRPADDKAPRKAPPVCPICQALHLSSLFVPPTAPITLASLELVGVVGFPRDHAPPASACNESARARAPPAMVAPLVSTASI
jgi:hypothetical protein